MNDIVVKCKNRYGGYTAEPIDWSKYELINEKSFYPDDDIIKIYEKKGYKRTDRDSLLLKQKDMIRNIIPKLKKTRKIKINKKKTLTQSSIYNLKLPDKNLTFGSGKLESLNDIYGGLERRYYY